MEDLEKELDGIWDSSLDERGHIFWRWGCKESCELIGFTPISVILPVIRRVWPQVLAHHIIGVQPMTGPVGQIHTLKTRYGKDSDA